MLSAASLHQVPDATQNRLDALLTGHGNMHVDLAGKQIYYTRSFSRIIYRCLTHCMGAMMVKLREAFVIPPT
jgi:hypothetical protein